MNLRTTLTAAAVILALVSTSEISAQTYSIGFDQADYQVDAGESFDAILFLTEDISDGGASRLDAGGDNGLFSFSAGIDFSSFSGGATGTIFDSLVLGEQFATGFAGSGQDVTVGDGVVDFEGTESFTFNPDGEVGAGGIMVSANEFVLELATLTFTAGADGSVTTLQTQAAASPAANPFIFGDGASPPIGFTSSTVSVSAIPEPGSVAVLALIAGAGLLRRRK